MYLHELKIGNVKLKNNILLAPMAGITDLPFRLICEKFEPGLVCTEMVSAKAIFYNDEKTKKLMNLNGENRPVSIQIFGSDVESMAYGAKYVSQIADIVDINMGCPAPKVVKNGDGSKLLLDLEKAKQIINAVVQNSKVPVTLKFRMGWDNEHIVATELAKIAEDAGISAITIHGRTRAQYYSGTADLEIIKKVKETVKIPVIGNGDVTDEKSAEEMFEKTGVDGIMIGRASMGNPWIFKKIKYYFETGEKLPEISADEKLKIVKEHLNLLVEEKGEDVAIKEFRKHLAAYSKNLPNSSNFRVKVNAIDDRKNLEKTLDEYFEAKERDKRDRVFFVHIK